ncbi:hydroxysteroid dehydrogenase-like protein 2 [Patiria miniata]|uniref:SCP2 domain-containing protein n=1 Tax=Patiria miniata TaxID=46514 RepID=A0A914A043_PATMI|nr:hydroxysteroid dehydrogenase-like protein 2 [Patiria miniata]
MESISSHQQLYFPSETELAFHNLRNRLLREGDSITRRVDAVLGFRVIDCRGGYIECWLIDLRQGRRVVRRANGEKTDIIFHISENDLMELFTGRQQPQKLLLTRRLRISGTKSLQNKIQYLIPDKRRKSRL